MASGLVQKPPGRAGGGVVDQDVDPIAHELVAELDGRTRRRTWELDSLKSRLGIV
jgi:hypothetical protein